MTTTYEISSSANSFNIPLVEVTASSSVLSIDMANHSETTKASVPQCNCTLGSDFTNATALTSITNGNLSNQKNSVKFPESLQNFSVSQLPNNKSVLLDFSLCDKFDLNTVKSIADINGSTKLKFSMETMKNNGTSGEFETVIGKGYDIVGYPFVYAESGNSAVTHTDYDGSKDHCITISGEINDLDWNYDVLNDEYGNTIPASSYTKLSTKPTQTGETATVNGSGQSYGNFSWLYSGTMEEYNGSTDNIKKRDDGTYFAGNVDTMKVITSDPVNYTFSLIKVDGLQYFDQSNNPIEAQIDDYAMENGFSTTHIMLPTEDMSKEPNGLFAFLTTSYPYAVSKEFYHWDTSTYAPTIYARTFVNGDIQSVSGYFNEEWSGSIISADDTTEIAVGSSFTVSNNDVRLGTTDNGAMGEKYWDSALSGVSENGNVYYSYIGDDIVTDANILVVGDNLNVKRVQIVYDSYKEVEGSSSPNDLMSLAIRNTPLTNTIIGYFDHKTSEAILLYAYLYGMGGGASSSQIYINGNVENLAKGTSSAWTNTSFDNLYSNGGFEGIETITACTIYSGETPMDASVVGDLDTFISIMYRELGITEEQFYSAVYGGYIVLPNYTSCILTADARSTYMDGAYTYIGYMSDDITITSTTASTDILVDFSTIEPYTSKIKYVYYCNASDTSIGGGKKKIKFTASIQSPVNVNLFGNAYSLADTHFIKAMASLSGTPYSAIGFDGGWTLTSETDGRYLGFQVSLNSSDLEGYDTEYFSSYNGQGWGSNSASSIDVSKLGITSDEWVVNERWDSYYTGQTPINLRIGFSTDYGYKPTETGNINIAGTLKITINDIDVQNIAMMMSASGYAPSITAMTSVINDFVTPVSLDQYDSDGHCLAYDKDIIKGSVSSNEDAVGNSDGNAIVLGLYTLPNVVNSYNGTHYEENMVNGYSYVVNEDIFRNGDSAQTIPWTASVMSTGELIPLFVRPNDDWYK